VGVKVQQVHISVGTKAQHFMMHVALVRTVRPDSVAIGSIALSVDAPRTVNRRLWICLPYASKQKDLPFNFRYFENFDQDVALPRASSQRSWPWKYAQIKGRCTCDQSFPWAVDAS